MLGDYHYTTINTYTLSILFLSPAHIPPAMKFVMV